MPVHSSGVSQLLLCAQLWEGCDSSSFPASLASNSVGISGYNPCPSGTGGCIPLLPPLALYVCLFIPIARWRKRIIRITKNHSPKVTKPFLLLLSCFFF